MSYILEISDKLKKIFAKIKKRDKFHAEILKRKIRQILDNPYQFKPLRGNMKGARRAHIGKSFVLTYEITENDKIIRLLDYDHHDKIYRK